MSEQVIKIKLNSFDHNLLDRSSSSIVDAVKKTGAIVKGPIPLPVNRKLYTILRSPHVNSKARDQYELKTHKRMIIINQPAEKTVDALMQLNLAAGVQALITVN